VCDVHALCISVYRLVSTHLKLCCYVVVVMLFVHCRFVALALLEANKHRECRRFVSLRDVLNIHTLYYCMVRDTNLSKYRWTFPISDWGCMKEPLGWCRCSDPSNWIWLEFWFQNHLFGISRWGSYVSTPLRGPCLVWKLFPCLVRAVCTHALELLFPYIENYFLLQNVMICIIIFSLCMPPRGSLFEPSVNAVRS
jgi:hypothetical protein